MTPLNISKLYTYTRHTFTALLLLVAGNASAQSSSSYSTSYNGTTTTSTYINHRAPMWYSYASEGYDGDGRGNSTGKLDNGQQVAHEYEETIYMHRGQTVALGLPCVSVDDNGNFSEGDWDYKDYYRWYDYGTDGVFSGNCKLKGGDYSMYEVPYNDAGRYQFANGYVGGMATPSSTPFGIAYFTYPSNTGDSGYKSEYYVACDYSNYNDYNSSTYTSQEDITTDKFQNLNFASNDATYWHNQSGGTNQGFKECSAVSFSNGTSLTNYTSSSYCYEFSSNGGWGTADNDLLYNQSKENLSPGTYLATAVIYVNGSTNLNNYNPVLKFIAENTSGTVIGSKLINRHGEQDYPYTLYMEFVVSTEGQIRIGIRTNTSTTSSLYFIATDFTVTKIGDYFGEDGTFTEPTLISRSIYHIIDVDSASDSYTQAMNNDDYKTGRDKYIEDYTITFPARHAAYSPETVGLAMDARAYAVPSGSDDVNNKSLNIDIDTTYPSDLSGFSYSGFSKDTNFQIYNTSSTVKNAQRAIMFGYGDLDSHRQWVVPDGTKVVITVTDGTHNIARFTITFEEDNTPLTDQQVKKLEDMYGDESFTEEDMQKNQEEFANDYGSNVWWYKLSTRSPGYLKNNFSEMASLYLDDYIEPNSQSVYDETDDVSGAFAAFPMNWDYTGYGFNNGTIPARSGNFHNEVESQYANNERVNAGQYAIMQAATDGSYYGWDDVSGTVKTGYAKENGAFLYVDGTQTPGEICTLPLKGSFCKGTRLYVIAWMKGANVYDQSTTSEHPVRDDSSIVMTILGNHTDDNGNTTSTEIESFSSGQIRLMSDAGNGTYGPYVSAYDDDGSDWGKGRENQWWQVAFTFTVTSDNSDNGEVNYDGYSLQLKNYSASSNGADFYFADLVVYVSHPRYKVSQIIQTTYDEENEKEVGLYRADFDYDALMITEGDDGTHTDPDGKSARLDFVIINENIYRDYLINETASALSGKGSYNIEDLKTSSTYYDSNSSTYTTVLYKLVEQAIEAAAVTLNSGSCSGTSYSETINRAAFYYNWKTNAAYDNDSKNIRENCANMIAKSTYGNSTWTDAQYTYDSPGVVWLYEREDGDNRKELSVDFYARINPYVPYRIIAVVHTDGTDLSGESLNGEASDGVEYAFACSLIDATCAMSKEFYFTSTTEVKLNGEILDPTQTYCEGQTNNISVHQTYVTVEYEDLDEDNVKEEVDTRTEMLPYSYCDWFYGTEDEYNTETSGYSPRTLLYAFRTAESSVTGKSFIDCPDLADVEKDLADGKTSDANGKSYDWYDPLKTLVKSGKIVLYEQTLNVYSAAECTNLVIQPIIHDGYPGTGSIPSELMVSYAYIALELRTGTSTSEGKASPALLPGFYDISDYPSNDTYYHLVPNIRLGLDQVNKAKESAITINLQKTNSEDLAGGSASNLAILTSAPYNYDSSANSGVGILYLTGSTDPYYHSTELLDNPNFSVLDLPVGTVSGLTLNDNGKDNNYLKIQFNNAASSCTCEECSCSGCTTTVCDSSCPCISEATCKTGGECNCESCACSGCYCKVTPFVAHEGYCYVMSVYFGDKSADYTPAEKEETDEDDMDDEEEDLVCPGLMQLELKVVPKYLVWQGDKLDNWNRDGAWDRAGRTDLLLGSSSRKDLNGNTRIEYALDSYEDNVLDDVHCGYVPMLFSNVLIPNDDVTEPDNRRHIRSEIYNAGFKKDASTSLYSWEDNVKGTGTYYGDGSIIIAPQTNIMYDLMVDGNLTTQHYRVNLCDSLQLASDGQMLHSELLLYTRANTDVKIPTNSWTLTSTALKDIYAGEWYTNKPARGVAPYFANITFNTDDNDRFDPIVYQRSWGEDGSTIIEETSVTDIVLPYYKATGWTSVYNDVTTPYQAGEGFAVKTFKYDTTKDPDLNNATFRLPKTDTKYNYYDYGAEASNSSYPTNNITKTNLGILKVSELVNVRNVSSESADKDYDDTQVYKTDYAPFSTTITSDNGFYIVGNPFTAPMSMEKFISDTNNSALSNASYWFDKAQLKYDTTDGTGNEVLTVNGSIVSTGDATSEKYIAPYGAFFVQPGSGSNAKGTRASSDLTVKFTKDMQAWEQEPSGVDSKLIAFSIRAKNGQGASSAAFAYFDDATDEYDASEDAVLLSDITWHSDSIPMVYTVAGDMAASVNRLHSLNVVPIGVFVADSCAYTLTFVGTYNLASPVLYDALNDTETEITEGMTLSLKGASHGRYFIKTTGIEEHGIEEAASEYSITAYSPADRTIVVSSNAEIESVEIYSIGGTLEKKVSGNGSIACTIDGVDSGIAVVRARTSEGTFTRKIIVR